MPLLKERLFPVLPGSGLHLLLALCSVSGLASCLAAPLCPPFTLLQSSLPQIKADHTPLWLEVIWQLLVTAQSIPAWLVQDPMICPASCTLSYKLQPATDTAAHTAASHAGVCLCEVLSVLLTLPGACCSPSSGQLPASLPDSSPEPSPLPLALGLAEEPLLCASHSLLHGSSWVVLEQLQIPLPSHPEPGACSYSVSALKSSASRQADLKHSVNYCVNEWVALSNEGTQERG